MFYNKQPVENQENYKNMLKLIGGLSKLFSEKDEPYLSYRAHENIFSKYFEVENNSRNDNSADAIDTITRTGIGLKTWVGQNNQKIAEFGRLRPEYQHLSGEELIREIAGYRNERIKVTKNLHGLNDMLYHIVKRIPGAMCIYESDFDEIDILNIVVDNKRGNGNNIYFSDGKNTYHFSLSKNTLYMIFENMELLDKFDVQIFENPYKFLEEMIKKEIKISLQNEKKDEKLCLRLYSTKSDGTKFVPEKAQLNQWNGFRKDYKIDKNTGKKYPVYKARNPNEFYISYPAEDRRRGVFFPPKDTPFELKLPDGKIISAKVCQADGKAIMSNPNKLLGKWILRDVFELEEGTLVTYEMLKKFNIDSVIFTKKDELKYTVDFCELGTYEKFYHIEDEDALYEENDL